MSAQRLREIQRGDRAVGPREQSPRLLRATRWKIHLSCSHPGALSSLPSDCVSPRRALAVPCVSCGGRAPVPKAGHRVLLNGNPVASGRPGPVRGTASPQASALMTRAPQPRPHRQSVGAADLIEELRVARYTQQRAETQAARGDAPESATGARIMTRSGVSSLARAPGAPAQQYKALTLAPPRAGPARGRLGGTGNVVGPLPQVAWSRDQGQSPPALTVWPLSSVPARVPQQLEYRLRLRRRHTAGGAERSQRREGSPIARDAVCRESGSTRRCGPSSRAWGARRGPRTSARPR